MPRQKNIPALRKSLLAHYDASGRALPWRIRPEDRAAGIVPDPYKVWLSEIMLQQTTVPHATPYWYKFLDRWPTVHDLATAPREDVMAAWAGLGYYARARNLHKCAKVVSEERGGMFPDTEKGLLALPGVGPYTAAAIGAICFDLPLSVVDGNVERVISRFYALQTRLPKSKPQIKDLAANLADPDRPGDYAQAVMDLGARVCRPKSPLCELCPWRDDCAGFAQGEPEMYPLKIKKNPLPKRYGVLFWVACGGEVLVRQRPDKGLLGGMLEFPGTEWTNKRPSKDAVAAAMPVAGDYTKRRAAVRHVFTHFELTLSVFVLQLAEKPDSFTGRWEPIDSLENLALPTVMKKAWKLATA